MERLKQDEGKVMEIDRNEVKDFVKVECKDEMDRKEERKDRESLEEARKVQDEKMKCEREEKQMKMKVEIENEKKKRDVEEYEKICKEREIQEKIDKERKDEEKKRQECEEYEMKKQEDDSMQFQRELVELEQEARWQQEENVQMMIEENYIRETQVVECDDVKVTCEDLSSQDVSVQDIEIETNFIHAANENVEEIVDYENLEDLSVATDCFEKISKRDDESEEIHESIEIITKKVDENIIDVYRQRVLARKLEAKQRQLKEELELSNGSFAESSAASNSDSF
ncbi:uncharacterized protein PHALS_11196 [Plasmopara halstedii]|uniref:Uncharacterized protein n=1 Tax=Plasmopara halstedii TaxID=4781 RepID=A0A0N7L5B7_PLAHL|nr:uncharacterized protein PHALS_11196 [Plasmopara halstedii]CEG41027.1 hypothetical protein PHALS_11196 [Plasmopara halstedii]|eukprot:XP_024577396.1 hypothetical protein PHALS_11196 [Plasmopara halstedii]